VLWKWSVPFRIVEHSVDVRRELVIESPAGPVWAVVAAAERQAEWFPGMVSSRVEGAVRTVVAAGGALFQEEILAIDHSRRTFEYRITGPILVHHHLGRIRVLDDEAGCRVVYEQEIDPKAMAPVLDAAVGDALEGLRDLVVHGQTSRGWESPAEASPGDGTEGNI